MKISKRIRGHFETCTAHDLTFGAHCQNCGLNAPKLPKPTREERIQSLENLGFKFPEKHVNISKS